MWHFLTDTWDYYRFRICLYGTLSLGILAGLLIFTNSQLFLLAVLVATLFFIISACRSYRYWIKKREGRVVKLGYGSVGHPLETHYVVELDPPGVEGTVRLSYSDWCSVIVGDYIVKNSRCFRTLAIRRPSGYTIEIRPKT